MVKPPHKWLVVAALCLLLLLAVRQASWEYAGFEREWRRNRLTHEVQRYSRSGGEYLPARNPTEYGGGAGF